MNETVFLKYEVGAHDIPLLLNITNGTTELNITLRFNIGIGTTAETPEGKCCLYSVQSA